MPNNTTDSLIYSTGSLLVIPLPTRKEMLVLQLIIILSCVIASHMTVLAVSFSYSAVKVITLQNNFWIVHLRERNSDNNDHASGVVTEI